MWLPTAAGRLALATLLLLPAPTGADQLTPATCLTPSIEQYLRDRASLTPEILAEIESLLAPRAGDPIWFSYVSPNGLFEMHYTNEGPDRVAQQDVDPPNGIPDLVENSAVWAEISWTIEVDSLGYPPPPLPADGTYDITFRDLGLTILGATAPQPSEGPDHTEIWLRRRFHGFGTDPDNLAKGTIAHEFKHALQYLVNHWAEQSWVELDANWVIDHVFDEATTWGVLNREGSQLSNPEHSLDHDPGGSYEDVLWEEYLSQKHGTDIVLDFWNVRGINPTQTVLESYRDAQMLYGAGWDSSYPEFMEWCWFSGSLADPGFGFEEADLFRDVALRELPITVYPHAAADSVAHLACHHRRLEPGNASRSPRILFDGDASHPHFTVSVIAGAPDRSFTIVRPALDGGQGLDYTVPDPWASLAYVGVIVTNSAPTGTPKTYSLQALEEATTDVGIIAASPSRIRAAPNPFRGSTDLRFTLARSARATVSVHDVRGRSVRTLWRGNLEGGEHELRWDGRADDGRVASAGVYWARVSTPEGVAARALIRVR